MQWFANSSLCFLILFAWNCRPDRRPDAEIKDLVTFPLLSETGTMLVDSAGGIELRAYIDTVKLIRGTLYSVYNEELSLYLWNKRYR